jgi:hypothetical protein
LALLSQALAAQFDAVGIVDEAVEDGVGERRRTEHRMGITPQTIFDYLERGWLKGQQLVKGQPWQIDLSDNQIEVLRAQIARRRRPKKEAL